MSYEPLTLKINNFQQYVDAFIDFTEFNVALIVGRRLNDLRVSNATGKSTIFAALSFVLFGHYNSETINGVVRDGQNLCYVEHEFKINDNKYKIIRKRSNLSNKSEILFYTYIDGDWKASDHRKNTDTQQEILSLIGINYVAWENSVLFAQEEWKTLVQATPNKRQALLREPLQLAIYSKFESIAKDRLKEAEKECAVISAVISELGNPSEDINILNSNIKLLESENVSLNEQYATINADLDNKKSELNDLDKLKNSDAATISAELQTVIERKKSISSSLSRLKQSVDSNNQSLQEHTNDISERLKNVFELQAEIDVEKNSHMMTEQDIEAEISNLSIQEKKGNALIASLEIKYEHLSSPLPQGSECTQCFNELTDTYRESISKLNLQKSLAISEDLNKYKNKMKKLLAKKEEWQLKLTSLRKSYNKVKLLESKILNEKQQINKFQLLLKQIKDIIDQNNKDILLKESEINILQDREKKLKQLSQNLNVEIITKKIVDVKSSISSLTNKSKEAFAKIATVSSKIGALKEKLSSRKQDLERLNVLYNDKQLKESSLKVKRASVKAFSSNGIPKLIINTILDDLQVESNQLLQEIRPELELQFVLEKDNKDTLDIIFKENGKVREYKMLSGGQKVFFAFAVQLGLSLVIQKRIGVDIKLLMFDEVDQPLDVAGQDSFVEIIKSLQKRFKVLVITHNDRLKGKFLHTILVEQGDEGSTAKVVTGW